MESAGEGAESDDDLLVVLAEEGGVHEKKGVRSRERLVVVLCQHLLTTRFGDDLLRWSWKTRVTLKRVQQNCCTEAFTSPM